MTDKPQKLCDETYEHDGHTVLFKEVPRHSQNGYKEERRRFEVYVDGDKVAVARMPYGFGKQAIRLDRMGGEYSYSGVFGHGSSVSWLGVKLFTLEALVSHIVIARFFAQHDFNKLYTLEELEEAEAAAKVRQERENNEREAEYRRDRKIRKAECEEQLASLTAELEAIEELLCGRSNIQHAALTRAATYFERAISDTKHSLYSVTERMKREGEL